MSEIGVIITKCGFFRVKQKKNPALKRLDFTNNEISIIS